MEPAAPTRRRWSTGEVIFRQGDRGVSMYLMLEGRVRLVLGEAGHEREIAVFNKGDFFGELAVLSGEPRSATAEVTEDALLLEIGPETFQMMVHDDLAIVRRIMEVQGQRVARTNQPILDLSDRLRAVRVAITCLRAARAGKPRLSIPELQKQSGVSAAAVRLAVDRLRAKVGGQVDGDQWTLDGDAEARIIDAMAELCAAD